MRSKDYTYDSSSTLKAYNDAFLKLEQAHIPFRIVTLETLAASDLQGIDTVVLAGAESMSDAEYNLIKTKQVVLLGKNGTKNEWGTARAKALTFGQVTDLASLQSPICPSAYRLRRLPSSSTTRIRIIQTITSCLFIMTRSAAASESAKPIA